MLNNNVFNLAEAYQRQAREVIKKTGVVGIWKARGMTINLVGSLRTGLLIKNRDIDFHIYADTFSVAESFAAMAELAENPGIRRINYVNLLDTDEKCLEWHAWYEDDEKNLWQLDMIHLMKDSPYAGKFERVAARIAAALKPETRAAILSIKNAVPEGQKVMGIEIYQAVLRDGVRTFAGFEEWRACHAASGIVAWEP